MAKLNLDFILIDESVVMNGFRVLMGGAMLDGFKANPVMLLMHNRATPGVLETAEMDVILPIGKWYDIRIEGNKLLAKPDFDDSDPFALKVQKKVEGGYMKGASIWLEPTKASDEAALKLPGQLGPTVTEWGVLEASIVDIPNCRNSLAIKNSAGNKIVLSGNKGHDKEITDFLHSLIQKKHNMDKTLLCATLGIEATSTDGEIATTLQALKTASTNSVQLATQNRTQADEIASLKKAATDKAIGDLVDGAITAKKLAAGDREKYVKLATADFDTVKELIEGMKAYESIESKLIGAGKNPAEQHELAELVKLSGEQLYMSGKLARLKDLDLELFKNKYREALGVEFK